MAKQLLYTIEVAQLNANYCEVSVYSNQSDQPVFRVFANEPHMASALNELARHFLATWDEAKPHADA